MSFRRTILLLMALLVPPMTVAVVARSLQYPDRFAEVIPEGLYRGGFPTSEHIRQMADEFDIKTIVSLTNYENKPKYNQELDAAKNASINVMRFPMPGNGCGAFEMLDGAADVLADRSKWPIFFHCAAGKQRSNATLAAYRMKHCGWPLDRALAELDAYDLDRVDEAVLCEHLAKYAEHLKATKHTHEALNKPRIRRSVVPSPGSPGRHGPIQYPTRDASAQGPKKPIANKPTG